MQIMFFFVCIGTAATCGIVVGLAYMRGYARGADGRVFRNLSPGVFRKIVASYLLLGVTASAVALIELKQIL